MAVQPEASKEGLILPPYQVRFTAEHYIAMAKKMSLKVAWVHLAYNVVDAVLTFPTGNALMYPAHVKCIFNLKVIPTEVNRSYNLSLRSC